MHTRVGLLLCLFALALFGAAETQQRFALVIGISGYESFGEGATIRFADRDATEFADFIKTPQGGAFPPANVHLVTNKTATRDKIYSELKWLNQAGPSDVVYVFFAGHGMQHDGLSFLLPATATRDNFESQGIRMDEFFERATSKLAAAQVVVFIDACHAAAAAEGARDPLSIDVQKQWMQVNAKSGQVAMALFSSTAEEKSWEDSTLGGGHGLFTWFLLEGLKGKAESSADGYITAEKALDYAKAEVSRHSRRRFNTPQTPIASSRFNPEFKLAFTGRPTLAHSPTEAPALGDIYVVTARSGVVSIDAVSKGDFVENEKKKFPNQSFGKHEVQIHYVTPDGAPQENQKIVVEVSSTRPGYASFPVKNPIDDLRTTPVGVFSLSAGPERFGSVFIDGTYIGMLPRDGEITVPNVTAGPHQLAVFTPAGATTERNINITARTTTRETLAAPTNLTVTVH